MVRSLRLNVLLIAVALVAAAVAGCEETGAVIRPDAGSDPLVDSGPPAEREISYTPEGCGYQVSSPLVDAAGMHEEVFGEASTLDHVHVSWAGAPESTFAVNWRSDTDTLASAVLYGTDRAAVEAADGPGAGVAQQVGHFLRFSSLGGRGVTRVHEVHVCGLSPSTIYYYRVGGPGHWSEVFETSTGPTAGSSDAFTFAVTGDSRGNEGNSWAMSQRRVRDRGVDFELFSGDAVILGPNQVEWNAFFEAADGDLAVQDLMSSMPIMMANGNHDALAVPFLAQFAFPQDTSPGETAQGEEWYSFDYANAHIVFLNDTVTDSTVLGGAEREWLESDLAAVDRAVTPWIFVVHHRPFYTCQSTHSPDTSLRSAWQPVFDQYAVDLVLTGHNHVYERSTPIRGLEGGEGVVAPAGANGVPNIDSAGVPSGTIYVVAAGVGAPLYSVNTDCPTSLEGQSVRNYVVVEVEGRSLRFTAYNAETDAEIDAFEYTK